MVPGLSEVALLAVVILGLAVFTGLGAGLVIRVMRGVQRFDPLAQRRDADVPPSSPDEPDERPAGGTSRGRRGP